MRRSSRRMLTLPSSSRPPTPSRRCEVADANKIFAALDARLWTFIVILSRTVLDAKHLAVAGRETDTGWLPMGRGKTTDVPELRGRSF